MTDVDQQAVAPWISAGTVEHETLRAWAASRGDDVRPTEASALRVLLKAGVEQLRESALEAAYEDLAEEFGQQDLAADRRVARDRYAARSDRGRE